MAKVTAEIMEGDEESDLESFFVKACGIDLRAYHKDRRILTKEIFEANFDNIMEIVEKRASSRKTYLVLGYFILITGAFLPEGLRTKIVDASKWEHEKGYWDGRFVRKRKFYLKDLREKVKAHRPGVKLHLVHLKNANDEDFTHGVIGLDQFWDCVDSGRITSKRHINLDSCGLTTIPEPIFMLDSLETLSLDNNNIRNISHLVRNLISLKRLCLDGNQLRILPVEIANLESLEVLSLERNRFKELPSFITGLRSLKKIYLRNNFINNIPLYLQKSEIFTLL